MMHREQCVQQYFDSAAPNYDRLSGTGTWARVRAAEHRAVARLLGPLIGQEVLELGCGTGHYAERMRERGARPFGVDSSPAMIRQLRSKGIAGACSSVARLDLGRKFSVILSAGLVEFLEKEEQLFSAAKRHAEPGARLVVLAPRGGLAGIVYELGHSWLGCPAKVRGVRELERAASANGWALEKVRGAGPLAVALRFRRASVG